MKSLILFFLATITTILWSCFNKTEILHKPTALAVNSKPKDLTVSSFHSLSAKTIDGQELSFEQYKGKKIIILNVASKCGYTPQYANWEKFYQENKDKVVVLGFPCNQFMGQEPGDGVEIKSFCQKNYGVSFPIFEKINVKGKDKSPVYAWLTDKSKNGWNTQEPTWNFCKYLINEKGELVEFFASSIKPDNESFIKAWAM